MPLTTRFFFAVGSAANRICPFASTATRHQSNEAIAKQRRAAEPQSTGLKTGQYSSIANHAAASANLYTEHRQ
jgi:hypothetical protein